MGKDEHNKIELDSPSVFADCPIFSKIRLHLLSGRHFRNNEVFTFFFNGFWDGMNSAQVIDVAPDSTIRVSLLIVLQKSVLDLRCGKVRKSFQPAYNNNLVFVQNILMVVFEQFLVLLGSHLPIPVDCPPGQP